MKPISRLQYITTSAALAEEACKGGADWIQLRLKDISYDDYKKAALEVQAVCRKYDATFIVNDNVKLALEINADGVHVGKGDPLPIEDIQAMLERDGIIGVTANDIDDFIHLAGKKVGYIGLGPFRFTETKKKLSPILGLDGYKKIFKELIDKSIPYPPVVGIGGVTNEDVEALLDTGLYGIAVSGAITSSYDIPAAVKNFKEAITQYS